MKGYLRILIFAVLFLTANAHASDFTLFKIAAFDKKDNKTNLGGNISLLKPGSQSCMFEYTDQERNDSQGYSLKISYDVEADVDGSAGIKIDLNMPDFAKGHYNLAFVVKGDKDLGYTSKFKVKLESPGKEAIQIADGVKDGWNHIYLSFSTFEGDIDWGNITGIYIIFDKDTVTEKKGVIYIDEIFLS